MYEIILLFFKPFPEEYKDNEREAENQGYLMEDIEVSQTAPWWPGQWTQSALQDKIQKYFEKMFIFKNPHLLESKEGIDSNTDKSPCNPASQNPLGM